LRIRRWRGIARQEMAKPRNIAIMFRKRSGEKMTALIIRHEI
jgi:hypothetical protein